MNTVNLVLLIILLLLHQILLELTLNIKTLLLQLILLLLYTILLYLAQRNQIQFSIPLNLQRKLPIQLRQIRYVRRFLIVHTVLDNKFLKSSHLSINLLRKSTVQLHHLTYKHKQLVLHLPDVARSPHHPAYLLYRVPVLFYW